MIKYLLEHENFVKLKLSSENGECDWSKLAEYHRVQIGFMQHERLVHLLVTLAFALFLMINIIAGLITHNIVFICLTFLIILLLIPYIIHYYRLENGVQRLYVLDREIEKKCNIS